MVARLVITSKAKKLKKTLMLAFETNIHRAVSKNYTFFSGFSPHCIFLQYTSYNTNRSQIIIIAGEISGGRKTEIIPISTSRENSVGPSKEQKQILSSSSEKNERPAFYTDRYFSSNFLSDSIPLSQMIRRN